MTEEPPSKKLLFICSDNAARSQIAEALSRMYGGNTVEAFSAGSRPAAEIDPRAVEFMSECGYDLSAHFPKDFGDIPPDLFDVVVTFDSETPTAPLRARRREHWEIATPDPTSPEEFRAMGVLIESNVRDLLSSLW